MAGAAYSCCAWPCRTTCWGFTDPRADVVSGAGVGMALATALRFWGTRTLVFRTAGTAAVRSQACAALTEGRRADMEWITWTWLTGLRRSARWSAG